MVLLSVLVIGILHTSTMNLVIGKNYGDRIQAHYLALAGIEKAKALLYQDAKDRRRAGLNHNGQLYDSEKDFREIKLGRGQFTVFRPARADEGGGVRYGVGDEESRLNLNQAPTNELAKIDGMTVDVMGAILDWRDGDNNISPHGAERDYYTSLIPPSFPRNGPFQTIRELLMVRGVSRDLLFGNSETDTEPLNPGQSALDAGWASLLTVDSTDQNINASGVDRVNVQSSDQSSLTGVKGITTDIARAIVSYRGQNQLQSIANLLDVTAAPPGGRGNQGNNNGPKVISQDLFLDIADDVTVDNAQDQQGLVNVNTASLEVLICLPGITRELAQALISHRQSDGYFANIGRLLKVPGMTQEIFKQLAPRITARSETFRILSEGKITGSGVQRRIQVVVHLGSRDIDTLSWREDDL